MDPVAELEKLLQGEDKTVYRDLAAKFVAEVKQAHRDKSFLDAPIALAEAIKGFDLHDYEGDFEPNQLYLQWTVDRYVSDKVEEILPRLNELYELLVKHNITQKNKVLFNDLDNSTFYIKVSKNSPYKVLVITTQSFNFLFGFSLNKWSSSLMLRRYWDEYVHDKYEEEEFKKSKLSPIKWAITKAEWYRDTYSDHIRGNQFVSRPSLRWWKKTKFKFDYDNDTHDDGNLLTYRKFGGRPECRGMLYRFSLPARALWEIPFALAAVKEYITEKS